MLYKTEESWEWKEAWKRGSNVELVHLEKLEERLCYAIRLDTLGEFKENEDGK